MAIACGNTFVLKPSERDPSAVDAGRRAVQGSRPSRPACSTSSTATRKRSTRCSTIPRQGGELRRLDADRRIHLRARLRAAASACRRWAAPRTTWSSCPTPTSDKAVDALMGAAYGSAGERCMAISVAVAVGDETADALVETLRAASPRAEDRPGDRPGSRDGPAGHRRARQARSPATSSQGVKEGAELVVDGRGLKLQGTRSGFFLGGSLFDHVTPDMTHLQEEIFGPVLCVVRAKSSRRPSISSTTTNTATAPPSSPATATPRATSPTSIQVGMVGINVPIPVPVAYHSFGGWKRSLFGDHSIYGPEGVRFYTRLKTVTARWPTGIRSGAEFNFPSLK